MPLQRLETWGIAVSDKRLFGVLLRPSPMSALVCAGVSFLVAIWVFATVGFEGSALEQQVAAWRVMSEEDNLAQYGGPEPVIAGIFNNFVLFTIWAIIGLLLYLFVVGIMRAVRTGVELKQELHFRNGQRAALLRTAFVHLGVRTLVGVVGVMYVTFFFGVVMPYCLSWLYFAAANMPRLDSVLYVLASLAVLAVALHVHIVLLRLLLLRPRITNSDVYL